MLHRTIFSSVASRSLSLFRSSRLLSKSTSTSTSTLASTAAIFSRHDRIPLSSNKIITRSLAISYAEQLEFEDSMKELDELHAGVRNVRMAAMRGLELNHPETGNYLTSSVLDTLHWRIKLLKGNWTANAVFIGSRSIYLYSNGIHPDDAETHGIEIFKKVQEIAETVEYFPEKNLLSLYSGYITGTPFGMLLSSTYRLGGLNTILAIDEPTRGQIPLGGLTYRFCLASDAGKIVARYLTCSGALIDGETLYNIGVLSHVSSYKPYLSLQYSDTIPLNDTKAIQPFQGEPKYLPDMVEDIHLDDAYEDISEYDFWNTYLYVPLDKSKLRPELGPGHLKRIYDDVEYCFSASTVNETITRLQSIEHPFARLALENMVLCDPLALESIYALTDFGNGRRIEIESLQESGETPENIRERVRDGFNDSLQKELKITELLIARQKEAHATGKSWVQSNFPKKSEFDLSIHEPEIEEETVDIEKKSLKTLAEEELQQKEIERLQNEKFESAVRQLKEELTTLPLDFIDDLRYPSRFQSTVR